MIDFRHVTIEDKGWISNCLKNRAGRTSEYSFGNIYSYGQVIDIDVACVDGCLVSVAHEDGLNEYCFPVGGDSEAALKKLLELIREKKAPAVIYGMNSEDALLFNGMNDGPEKAKPGRDWFDYCYRSDDLINLRGKKYQSKRNHISFFERNNNWSYETLRSGVIPECLEMSEKWLEEYETEDKSELETELKIIKNAFEYYDEIGYRGGVLRADGLVIAYTFGEELDSSHFCVHFEKAFSGIRGAYPMINREFVKNELSAYEFINREDDVGRENLRRAKLSYHPAYLAEKFEVFFYTDADS